MPQAFAIQQGLQGFAITAAKTRRWRLERDALRESDRSATDIEAHVCGRFLAQVEHRRGDGAPETRSPQGIFYGQGKLEPRPADRVADEIVGSGKRARLEHRDQVAIAIAEPEFVEDILVEAHEAEFEAVPGHAPAAPCEVPLHESHGGCVELAVMQTDAQ